MRPIADGFSEKLKTLVPLSDVFTACGIELKKSGNGLACLSPFRDERTPSLHVNDRDGVWNDFGDNTLGGDHYSFLTRYEGLSFPDAITRLAQIGQVPVEYKALDEKAKRWHGKTSDIYNANEWGAKAYFNYLKNSQEGIDYICGQRGINKETIIEFGVGFAPGGWRSLRSLATNEQLNPLVDADLLIRSEKNGKKSLYDKFFNAQRVIFPIKNTSGKVVGFGGRKLDNDSDSRSPKYINTAETLVYKKSNELYGLYETLKKHNNKPGSIIVSEGYLDVLTMHQNGITNATSSNGTAITSEQIKSAFKYTDNIKFAFDGDPAGIKAAFKAMDEALPMLEDGRSIGFVFTPVGEDPDSLIRKHGVNAMKQLINNPVDLAGFLAYRAKFELDMSNEEHISIAAKRTVDLVSNMPMGIMRDRAATMMGKDLGVAPERLLFTIDKVANERLQAKEEQQAHQKKVPENENRQQPRKPKI